jgi:collagenase-like PrtC family protease
MKNRSVKFLRNAAKYCNDNDVQLELMVNEFCGVGSHGYATHCVLRDSCYLCHASNVTKEDALLFNNYPMGHCMDARNADTLNWLRVRWIRPEDIKRYNDIGIRNWKITGRTGTTDYIMKVAQAYISQKWNGNLLDLWKPLETIYSGESENSFKQKCFIDNTKLDGFIDHWFEDEDFECSDELCGTTCEYCKLFYEKIK